MNKICWTTKVFHIPVWPLSSTALLSSLLFLPINDLGSTLGTFCTYFFPPIFSVTPIYQYYVSLINMFRFWWIETTFALFLHRNSKSGSFLTWWCLSFAAIRINGDYLQQITLCHSILFISSSMQKHVSYIGYCDNGLDPLLYYYYFFIKQGSVSKQAKNIELYIAFYTQELQSTFKQSSILKRKQDIKVHKIWRTSLLE